MLIRTSERCPECDAIVYLLCHPQLNKEGEIIVKQRHENELPHAIADGCYIDTDGILCIGRYDDETKLPDYLCIFCRWSA